MNSTQDFDESIYIDIVCQFDCSEPDMGAVFRIVNNVCRAAKDTFNYNPLQNALMLVLGLMHQHSPMEHVGKELHEMEPEHLKNCLDALRMHVE